MSQKRKSPVRHLVSSFLRDNGERVRSHVRGRGSKPQRQLPSLASEPYLNPPTQVNIEFLSTIRDADLDGYVLQTDSQDVESIRNSFGNPRELRDFEGFFVKIKDGEIEDVLGFGGSVPANGKSLYRISMGEPKQSRLEKAKEIGTRYAKSGARAGLSFAKKAGKVGAESIRETAIEGLSRVEQSNLRNMIQTALYDPSLPKRALAQNTIKSFYPEIYETLQFTKPDRNQALLDIARKAKSDRDSLLENAPENEEEG